MVFEVVQGSRHQKLQANLLADHQPQVLKPVLLKRHAAKAMGVDHERAIVGRRSRNDPFELVERLVGDGRIVARHTFQPPRSRRMHEAQVQLAVAVFWHPFVGLMPHGLLPGYSLLRQLDLV